MSRWLARWAGLCFFTVLFACGCWSSVLYAQTLQSPSYRFEESTLGSGGLNQSASNNYQIRSTVGDAAIGNSASTGFQSDAGSQTTADPALRFYVNNSTPNFGQFSATSTSTTTSSFSVSNYTSYGYVVQILGSPPTNTSHTIDAMATTGPAITGIDQFGINLVANTSPTSVGANPQYEIFGAGSVAPNYSVSNQYRFVSGETIATGAQSSGITNYTISYIVNVSSLTPGGQYVSNQTLICVATF